jgi:hypothetical protein
MTEDQSVVGRRRIYYDSDGNETLIASDSEEEDAGEEDDKEEAKHEFTKGEDSIIWYLSVLQPFHINASNDGLDSKVGSVKMSSLCCHGCSNCSEISLAFRVASPLYYLFCLSCFSLNRTE